MDHTRFQGDSKAWLVYVWVSFAVSVGSTVVGIYCLPADLWIRAFLAMGILFSVGSALTLSKTVRDQHESKRLHNLLVDAQLRRELDAEAEVLHARRAA